MIKLKDLIKEDEEDPGIDIDRLHYNDSYLDDVAEEMGYKMDFAKIFWSLPHVPTLYHCTEPDRWDIIKFEGLKTMRGSRGLSNTSIGHAVFTTMEEEEIPFFRSYYGDTVIKINTQQMKSDGFMPDVSRELDWDRAQKLEFVLQKLGKHEAEAARFVDSSDQNTQGTVILYSDIPVKYLSIVDL